MATVAQSVSLNAHGGVARIQEGNKTAAVYTLIKDGKYGDAVRILSIELQNHPKSRAALSLLGYCYYYMQDFPSAATTYDLVHYSPAFFPLLSHYPFSLSLLIQRINHHICSII